MLCVNLGFNDIIFLNSSKIINDSNDSNSSSTHSEFNVIGNNNDDDGDVNGNSNNDSDNDGNSDGYNDGHSLYDEYSNVEGNINDVNSSNSIQVLLFL